MSLLILLALMPGFCTEQNLQETNPDASLSVKGQIFFNPFHIQIDPMERLLLVNIENDPDSLYIGFEPQVFNDNSNGQGMLIIAWRTDGYIDVYHQPGLNPDPTKYGIAGKGLKNIITAPLTDAYFQVEEQGVKAWFSFEDILGRTVEVRIAENNSRTRKPFGLLAPMGQAATHPPAMPLVLLHDFYFVRQKDTEISVSINGRKHAPDKLPMPIDRQKMYFARYSPDPLIATLNPAQQGPLEHTNVTYPASVLADNTQLQWENRNGQNHLKSIVKTHEHHRLTMNFEPAFPDIMQMQNRDKTAGKFNISGHRSTGSISGKYHIIREGDKVFIHLHPSGGWKPRAAGKFSLRFLYTVAGVFRKWPKTYEWNAVISLQDGTTPHMEAAWERIYKE